MSYKPAHSITKQVRRLPAMARAAILAVSLLATGTGIAAVAAPAGALSTPSITPYTVSAATSVRNRPDSGVSGNWALDNFLRDATVRLVSEVALSYCGGSTSTGHCYHWTGSVRDAGTFTTVVGATSPGVGYGGGQPLAVAVTGQMGGGISYSFYSSWKTARASSMPSKENDAGNVPGGRSATGAWVEQFFGAGARFFVGGALSDSLTTKGSWAYQADFGSDAACPNIGSRWVDGSPDWGSLASDGNILSPDASHC